MDTRGQALTLEATLTSLLLVTSLALALQLTAGSTLETGADQHECQETHEELGTQLLRTASADGTLSAVVRFWNESEGRFEGSYSTETGYTDGIPGDPETGSDRPSEIDLPSETNHAAVLSFGSTLESTFSDDVAYNVRINYVGENGTRRTQHLVDQGTPSESAVTATQLVTLFDDEPLTTDSLSLSNSQTFFAVNADEHSPVYQVLEVELHIWRR
ncbi:hypothetical protein OB905_12365 [Halobacteria archaeon AArc-dxtr1]|nr:hypothetical protein [Halobacteria archaeon AArc-dxtr1]